MNCDHCHKHKPTQKIGTNKGIQMWCPDCIVEDRKTFMRKHKCDLLLLHHEYGGEVSHVTDMTGHFKIPIIKLKRSKNNFAGKKQRIDLWFEFEGHIWYGYHVGYRNIYVNCRETKQLVKG